MRMLVHGECIGATHTVHVQQQGLEVSLDELLSGKREVRGSRAASKYAVSITSPRTDRVQYIYVRESRNRNHGRRPLRLALPWRRPCTPDASATGAAPGH
jgi:hypothetical protein